MYQAGADSLGYVAEKVGLSKRDLIREARTRGIEPPFDEQAVREDQQAIEMPGTDVSEDERAWLNLSLTLAMRGMEDEEMPKYTIADLKERFSSVDSTRDVDALCLKPVRCCTKRAPEH